MAMQPAVLAPTVTAGLGHELDPLHEELFPCDAAGLEAIVAAPGSTCCSPWERQHPEERERIAQALRAQLTLGAETDQDRAVAVR
eukprot:SAG31_NODE_3329_length_4400_cov_2.494071_5_plen_85_part_00